MCLKREHNMLKKIIIFILAFLALAAVGVGILLYAYRSGDLQKMVVSQVGQKFEGTVGGQTALEEAMGFFGSKTYLVLFLNNTELRPAGGFIGAYAVVKVDKGLPELLKVEGTEILDNYANKNVLPEPPTPLKNYLKVEKWFFRDSNWSPDFSISAAKALELYKLEKGIAANEIDGVIGFTPTILEEVLKITGPIVVNNEEFNSQNFIEKLEYEVEYNYANKNLNFDQRKKMLVDITHVLFAKMRTDVILNWSKYFDLAQKMLKQKQVVAYGLSSDSEAILAASDWAGKMKKNSGDYLMWVDANLGALKTDASMKRELTYTINIDKDGNFLAEAKMKFLHQGKIDWRTSQYLDYARVYVPEGSMLVEVRGADVKDYPLEKMADSGLENGRQWFGAFTEVKAGQIKEMSFKFKLAPQIVDQIKKGEYNLLVQKQIGTLDNKLTLNLDFGKKIEKSATDLTLDREFKIKF